MNTNNKITQKIVYPAFVNRLAGIINIIVPDLDIDVADTELDNAISIAKFLVQREIDRLHLENKETPPPRVLSQAEVLEYYKYGQELIAIDAVLEFDL